MQFPIARGSDINGWVSTTDAWCARLGRSSPGIEVAEEPSPAEIAEIGAGLKREAKTATELAIQLRELDAGKAAIQEALADESDPAPEPNPLSDPHAWDQWHLSRLRRQALPGYLATQEERRAELYDKLSRLAAWMANALRYCDAESRAKYQRIVTDARACL